MEFRASSRKLAFFILTLTVVASSQAPSTRKTPTFYIAASGEFSKFSTSVTIKGASNLPTGARLDLTMYDFIGYQSSILSEKLIVALTREGFFEATLKPLPGTHFRPNMVCDISFQPHGEPQEASVLKIVGRHGELL